MRPRATPCRLTYAAARDATSGTVLRDDAVSGLHLRCRASGKGWYLYYRTRDGRERRPKLGAFPALGIEAARSAARDLLQAVARGEDPSGEWQAARAAPTVADLCERYLQDYAPARKSPSSVTKDREMILTHVLRGLGSMRVRDVQLTDIDKFLARVRARAFVVDKPGGGRPNRTYRSPAPSDAPGAANRVRALLSKLFSLAERDDWGLRPRNSNPVRGAVIFPTPGRRRMATREELPALCETLHALRIEYPRQVAFVWCLFLTGARTSEIRNAHWSDLDGQYLKLERHKTVAHTGTRLLYIPTPAMQALATMQRGSGAIFGNISLERFWERVRRDAGLGDLQMRDARRTFASVAKSSGSSLTQIGELLGHRVHQTTLRYAHLFREDAEAHAERAATRLLELAAVASPARDDHWSG